MNALQDKRRVAAAAAAEVSVGITVLHTE